MRDVGSLGRCWPRTRPEGTQVALRGPIAVGRLAKTRTRFEEPRRSLQCDHAPRPEGECASFALPEKAAFLSPK